MLLPPGKATRFFAGIDVSCWVDHKMKQVLMILLKVLIGILFFRIAFHWILRWRNRLLFNLEESLMFKIKRGINY